MSVVLFKNLLAKLQKANQKARGAQAIKAGFQTYEEYKAYLQEQIKNCSTNVEEKVIQEVPDKVKKVESKKKVVHTIDLVDASYSMSGNKLREANKAVKQGLEELKKESLVDNYYSLWSFSGRFKIKNIYKRLRAQDVDIKKDIVADDMTAIYLSIKEVINSLENKDEVVLLNVYTDGGDNQSSSEDIKFVKEYIKNNKQNFVVTFIGTEYDVNAVTKVLGLDSSNTLTYDGSSEGLKDVMQKTTASRKAFSGKVAKNDMTFNTGFYKDFK